MKRIRNKKRCLNCGEPVAWESKRCVRCDNMRQFYASIMNGSVPKEKPLLTDREKQVVISIANGLTAKAIAIDHGVSVKTIERQRQAVYDKVGVHCVSAATRWAIREGLVEA
jgi:DNA-binding NarL/FixJ family response regulator